MMLCMDEYGRIYQASVDHANATGVERLPDAVSDFGVNSYQNPYLKTMIEAGNEAKMLQNVQAIEDKKEEAMGHHRRAMKKEAMRRAENEIKHDRMNRAELVEEAVLAGLGSADFDQLSIVDAQYGPRHQAMLQSMGMKPQLGEVPYLKDASYSNPLEVEQASLRQEATKEMITQRLSDQRFQEEAQHLKNLPDSYKDQEAQIMLQGEGEIYFDTEDEALAYDKMSKAQQDAYIKERGVDVGAEPSKPMNKVALAAGILAAIFFMS